MTDDKNFTCIVSADLFRRASFAVSTEEVRYYLNGAFVEPCAEGGATITATNGHFLISIRDPNGVVEGYGIVRLNKALKDELKRRPELLTSDRVLMVRSTSPKRAIAFVADIDPPHSVEGVQVKPRLSAGDLFDAPDRRVAVGQYGDVLIDGTFPDWKRVVPMSVNWSAPVAPFDQALLAKISEALSPGKSRNVRVGSTGDASMPHLVFSEASGGPEGFGVLMPVRGDKEGRTVPAWAVSPALAKAA